MQLRSYRHRLVDPDVLAAISGFASSALLGYPLVVAGAYFGSQLVRDSGKGLGIALLLFLGIWGFTAMAFAFFIGAMQTARFSQALLFGAVVMIAAIFVAAGWGLYGGDPNLLKSRKLPVGLFLTVVIAGLWHLVLDITNTSWEENRLKIGAIYGVIVALLTVSVGLGVQLALEIAAD